MSQVDYTKLRAALDAAAQSEWSVTHPGQRSLDPTRVSEYLKSVENVDDRLFLSKVLADTQYISWSSLMQALEGSYRDFFNKIESQPFYLYISDHRFGSELVFMTFLWNRLKQLNLQGFKGPTSRMLDGDRVVVIDDAIYSGIYASSILDNICYDNKGVDITFHLVVPYQTFNGLTTVRHTVDMYPGVKLISHPGVIPIRRFVEKHPECTEQMLNSERFGLELASQVGLYFDHKVANEFSTFSSIYLNGRIPGQADFGSLLELPPDVDLKARIWKQHFVGVLPGPTNA